MRLIVGGGRAAESSESKGSVVVGVRTLSEGGRVGNFSREQVCYYLSLSLPTVYVNYIRGRIFPIVFNIGDSFLLNNALDY